MDLSWSAVSDEKGGSRLKAYTIIRSDQTNTTIAATRTTFSDTNLLKSAATLTYSVVTVDNAGNTSPTSNLVSVTTPSCPVSSGERVLDSASLPPLGKAVATYGARAVVIYVKQEYLQGRDAGLVDRDVRHGRG